MRPCGKVIDIPGKSAALVGDFGIASSSELWKSVFESIRVMLPNNLAHVAARIECGSLGGPECTDPPNVAADPYMKCISDLSADPQFAGLSKKLPLTDINTVTFAILADESYPTPAERKDILACGSNWSRRSGLSWRRSRIAIQ